MLFIRCFICNMKRPSGKEESNPKWFHIFIWSVHLICTLPIFIWSVQIRCTHPFETVSDRWSSIVWSMSSVRAHLKWSLQLDQVFRWSEQLGQLVRWSAHWDPISKWVHIFRWSVQIQIYSPAFRWSEQCSQLFRWSAHWDPNPKWVQISDDLPPYIQMKWTTWSTFQMKCTLRSKSEMSSYFQVKCSDSDILPHVQMKWTTWSTFQMKCTLRPTLTQTQNEFIFSDEVFRFRYTPHVQMEWTMQSTFQMKCTLRPKPKMSSNFRWFTPLHSDEVNNLVNFSDEVHTEIQIWNEFIFSGEAFRFRYTPPCSDEVNNLVNFSDEVHTETQTQNEFIFQMIYPPAFRWSEQLGQLFRWSAHWDPNLKWVHIFRWSVQIQIYPPYSDEVNNLVNFSDEVHTETQTRNEFVFSDEVFRFIYTPHIQMRWRTWSTFQMKCTLSPNPKWGHIFRWSVQIQIYPPGFRWTEQLGKICRWSAHWDQIYPQHTHQADDMYRGEWGHIFRWSVHVAVV